MLPMSLLLALQSAHAVDISVREDHGGDLQAALNAVTAGDVLLIDVPGGIVDQTASAAINGGFTIRGADGGSIGEGTTLEITANNAGNNAVVIEDLNFFGPHDDPGLIISGKNAELYDVSFTGYLDYTTTIGGTGSAFAWSGSADNVVLLDGVYVSGNNGPAIWIAGGDAEIYSSEFNGNGNGTIIGRGFFNIPAQNGFPGGGLHFDGDNLVLGAAEFSDRNEPDPDITHRGNTFRYNTAVYGGGAYVRANSGKIEANTFEFNVANDYTGYSEVAELNTTSTGIGFLGEGRGGGLMIEDSGEDGTIAVRWNEIGGNWAWQAAGIEILDTEDIIIENNAVVQNWAIKYGGGLSMDNRAAAGVIRPVIRNNTFVGNLAGLSRVLLTVQVVGGGGNLRFDSVIPEFTNNVVSNAFYGGGVLGKARTGSAFEPGDDFNTFWRYNVFYANCDINGCVAGDNGDEPLTGNYRQYALHPSNITDVQPDFIYFGDIFESSILTDNDPYPDVLCLTNESVGIGAGDPNLPNLDDPSYGSDVGHCGGVECIFWNRDRDEDGWLQHQDCLDDPNANYPGRPLPEEINPDAEEVCDYEDNDCDGLIDEGFINKWYPDADGDGWGDDKDAGLLACDVSEVPAGYVDNNDDCDDTRNDVYGGSEARELCDNVDNDCDGIINEADGDIDAAYRFRDFDGDGYGSDSTTDFVCQNPDTDEWYAATPEGEDSVPEDLPASDYNYWDVGDDCNDSDLTTNPGAPEICDDQDHNCNGERYDVADGDDYYLDTDRDGWGDLSSKITVCAGEPLPDGNYVELGGDCDETNTAVNYGAEEVCDGIDNDCNAIIDDDPADGVLLYEDFDNDGFGNPATALRACAGSHGSTFTASVGGDCDDSDASVGECSECGCQAIPTPGSVGFLGTGLLALFGLRRRR